MGGPQPRSHLLEGGQQHVAVPGVLCKKTPSGGAQGPRTSPPGGAGGSALPCAAGKINGGPLSPSPSSTTACTTMGNTSRSRSKPSCPPEERLGQEERGFGLPSAEPQPPNPPGLLTPKGMSSRGCSQPALGAFWGRSPNGFGSLKGPAPVGRCSPPPRSTRRGRRCGRARRTAGTRPACSALSPTAGCCPWGRSCPSGRGQGQ